jgi:UDP-galactopyranose mutase
MANAILVVGAGFAGAVHARELAEAGYLVHVIDKRDHIAGNAFDYIDANGVRVHRYGPHLFHTNSDAVVQWLARFGKWQPYEHRVRAKLADGRFAPLPVNKTTIEMVFNKNFESAADVETFLERVREPIADPANAGEFLYSRIGAVLTDLFFRPYTKKMWALDLEEMHASVVRRIPLRFDDESRYFPNDRYQLLPVEGYTAIVAAILDHPQIRVTRSVAFERAMEADYVCCFNSMPIDEYFGFTFGELPYRSIRFHNTSVDLSATPSWSVINYTDSSKLTRETWWHALPSHKPRNGSMGTMTQEEPCDYRDNAMERYYPVKTADDRHTKTYGRYRDLAANSQKIRFIGRCGTYQYLDMDQVVNQSLQQVRAWIAQHP